ncbi:F0F1 ATP synthase subunit B family protein [Candidatus Jidaibacter acanthamoebae]|nr:hypothetical protein [Candidatus Jidaibacter acanthamoeba]
MFNEGFWVLASFIIFIGAIFKPVKAIVLKTLDERTDKIIHDLNEAAKIKENALSMLQAIKIEHDNIKQNAKDILDKAHLEAKSILEESKKQAEKITRKRLELTMQRISQQEQQIIRDIKTEAVDSALAIVQQMLIEDLDKNIKLDLIDDSIKSLKKFVH